MMIKKQTNSSTIVFSTTPSSMKLLLSLVLLMATADRSSFASAFAVGGNSNNSNNNKNKNNDDISIALFDRFRVTCPADPWSIQQFDPRLVSSPAAENNDTNDVWAAVFRSNNNKPSVYMRDELFSAMRSATTDYSSYSTSSNAALQGLFISSSSSSSSDAASTTTTSMAASTPVAVARLRLSSSNNSKKDDDNNPSSSSWILDNLRCVLRKEETDASCDGGSEHTEALSTAIDALLEYYLTQLVAASRSSSSKSTSQQQQKQQPSHFEGAIRVKATIYSANLLEDRGFEPVSVLGYDMATHVSSLDACMQRYAERSITKSTSTATAATMINTNSPGTRQRALNIVSLLGRLDRQHDLRTAAAAAKSNENEDDDTEEQGYDPWASVKRFI